MKCPFTKALFRLKCPGLTDNALQISSKTNCRFSTPVSFQRNERDPNEDQQWLPQTLGCGLGRFVRRYNDCKYPHTQLSACENKENSKKIIFNRIDILTPFVIST